MAKVSAHSLFPERAAPATKTTLRVEAGELLCLAKLISLKIKPLATL
jgi:hypothetical protein